MANDVHRAEPIRLDQGRRDASPRYHKQEAKSVPLWKQQNEMAAAMKKQQPVNQMNSPQHHQNNNVSPPQQVQYHERVGCSE